MQLVELLLQLRVLLPVHEVLDLVRHGGAVPVGGGLGGFMTAHELRQLLEEPLAQVGGVCPLFHAYARRDYREAARRVAVSRRRARHRILEAGNAGV
jgi:hypothetical protein